MKIINATSTMSTSFLRFALVAVANILFLLISVSEVNALKCIQCKGSPTINLDCYSGQAKAMECPWPNHTFCLSYSGHLGAESTFLVVRNCSTQNITTECQSIPLQGMNRVDNGQMHVCFHSCNSDGCNNLFHSFNAGVVTRCSVIQWLLMSVPLVMYTAVVVGGHHSHGLSNL